MRYKILDQSGLNFLTFTVVDWVDVFTRPDYKDVIIESLDYCQKNKGLKVYAYVIMTSHVHLIVQAEGKIPLSDIVRDFKKYTASTLLKMIVNNKKESRREWLLHRFQWNAKQLAGDRIYQFWQNDNHAIALYSPTVIWQKIDYVHSNPVAEGIVTSPEHYKYSSASDYTGNEGKLKITLMDHFDTTGYVHTGM